jgi:hypothetical protein
MLRDADKLTPTSELGTPAVHQNFITPQACINDPQRVSAHVQKHTKAWIGIGKRTFVRRC